MNYDSIDVTGCRVLITLTGESESYESVVLEDDKKARRIKVRAPFHMKEAFFSHADVLIYIGNQPIKCAGTFRQTVDREGLEIAIYNTSTKEDRRFPRYALSIDGSVDALMFGDQIVDLRKLIAVVAVNISSSGVLVRAGANTFTKGMMFRLRIESLNTKMLMACVVVRIDYIDYNQSNYACEFMLLPEEQE